VRRIDAAKIRTLKQQRVRHPGAEQEKPKTTFTKRRWGTRTAKQTIWIYAPRKESKQDYSVRRVWAGSVAARRAGIRPAKVEATASVMIEMPSTLGSTRFTS
jgi:hypothetical protein